MAWHFSVVEQLLLCIKLWLQIIRGAIASMRTLGTIPQTSSPSHSTRIMMTPQRFPPQRAARNHSRPRHMGNTSRDLASEYARLRAEVVDLARRGGVSGRSVEDLRRAIHTLRSTSEGTFVSICDRVTQINTIAKDATAGDWGTWKNEWACAYDGKVHGSFMTATDALDDMKQRVIWQSSFKWFVSDSPATSSCKSEVVHAWLPPPQGDPTYIALGPQHLPAPSTRTYAVAREQAAQKFMLGVSLRVPMATASQMVMDDLMDAPLRPPHSTCIVAASDAAVVGQRVG